MSVDRLVLDTYKRATKTSGKFCTSDFREFQNYSASNSCGNHENYFLIIAIERTHSEEHFSPPVCFVSSYEQKVIAAQKNLEKFPICTDLFAQRDIVS